MNANEIVTQFYQRVYNEHRTEHILRCYAEDYIEHHEGGANSNHAAKQIVEGAFEIFPDLCVTMQDIVCEQDMVAVRATFEGTQNGKFLDLNPTGQKISWEAMEFFRVKDDQIIESWGSWPLYEMRCSLQKEGPTSVNQSND